VFDTIINILQILSVIAVPALTFYPLTYAADCFV